MHTGTFRRFIPRRRHFGKQRLGLTLVRGRESGLGRFLCILNDGPVAVFSPQSLTIRLDGACMSARLELCHRRHFSFSGL